jgi:hypothetical protein
VLGSGHPEKQALKHAELTNPQSLNKYQYTFNNPLRYVDPDGQSPQDSYELNLERDERALLAGRISPEQFLARQNARGAGAVAGLVILAAVRGGAPIVQGLMLWATRNPDKVENLAQMLQEAGGGPPGLTLLPSSRLSSAERATGERLAQQLGVALEESAHAGEEYIVRGANKTIDAMGGPEAFQKGVMSEILASIDRHLNKVVDYTAIDLRGASKEQIKALKDYVNNLTKEQQARIIYVQ